MNRLESVKKTTAEPKIIGIDARLYGPTGLGLGRYIAELVDRIVKLDQKNHYILFLGPSSFKDCQINQKNVSKVIMKQRWYTLSEQLVWPCLIARYRLDLLHVPHFNAPLVCSCKLVITVHDLILTKFPSRRASQLPAWLYWFKNLAYRVVISSAVRRAKTILTVSEFTKNDLVNTLRVPASKIIVTYNGLTNNLATTTVADKRVLLGYNIKQPYWLYVGSAYPHKNLEWLVHLFKEWSIDQLDYQLVLVGRHDYFYQRVIELINRLWPNQSSRPVITPGFVPDQHLATLYQLASLYVFPSRYEGFGLPPLEAMSYGCPVASSDSSCLPEILGSASEFFKDNNIESAKLAINQVINNPERRKELIRLGYQQANQYSWDTCAQQTLDSYYQVL